MRVRPASQQLVMHDGKLFRLVREARQPSLSDTTDSPAFRQLSVYLVAQRFSLSNAWFLLRCFCTTRIAFFARRRPRIGILRYTGIKARWFHRTAGIAEFLRHMLDTRIALGRSRRDLAGLDHLFRNNAGVRRATARRRGQRKAIGSIGHDRKKAQNKNAHKLIRLPGPSSERQ